jgi:chromosome segregation ATPase
LANTNTERIQDLERIALTLKADFAYLKQALTDATTSIRDGENRIAELEKDNALLKQRLDDQIKRLELWAGRLWGFIMLLVGAVLSLASGLIVTLTKR